MWQRLAPKGRREGEEASTTNAVVAAVGGWKGEERGSIDRDGIRMDVLMLMKNRRSAAEAKAESESCWLLLAKEKRTTLVKALHLLHLLHLLLLLKVLLLPVLRELVEPLVMVVLVLLLLEAKRGKLSKSAKGGVAAVDGRSGAVGGRGG